MVQEFHSLDVRPYQLLCVICRLGAQPADPYYFPERLDEILAWVRGDSGRPMTLRCNADSVYAYQNPSRRYDTPEGELFNDKRDLDILQRLGMAPGATRPGIELFRRIGQEIASCRGICGYDGVTSEDWRGCRLAASGNYERGYALGAGAVVPPRAAEERAAAKRDSCAAMYRAAVLRIRPHHLMCMTDFQQGQTELKPIAEDNLFEATDIMQKNPEIPVQLVAGPCMICPPCTPYCPGTNLCIDGSAMGLRDQKKDLDVLQILGLRYGDVLPARRLLQRLYSRIQSTVQVCGYKDGVLRSPEWRVCGGPNGDARYLKGRAVGMGVPGVCADPRKKPA